MSKLYNVATVTLNGEHILTVEVLPIHCRKEIAQALFFPTLKDIEQHYPHHFGYKIELRSYH